MRPRRAHVHACEWGALACANRAPRGPADAGTDRPAEPRHLMMCLVQGAGARARTRECDRCARPRTCVERRACVRVHTRVGVARAGAGEHMDMAYVCSGDAMLCHAMLCYEIG